MKNRPTHDVHQMMSFQNRMAYILPALLMPIHIPLLQFNLREHRVRHVRVLIQRHIAALPHRKITILDAEILRIGANADLVQIIFVARSKFNPDSNSAIRFRLFTVVPDYREPILDGLTGNDPPSGDRGGPDLVRAEDVVVLDVELDAGHGMRERHPEPLEIGRAHV